MTPTRGLKARILRDQRARLIEAVVLVPANAQIRGQTAADPPGVVEEQRMGPEVRAEAQRRNRVVLNDRRIVAAEELRNDVAARRCRSSCREFGNHCPTDGCSRCGCRRSCRSRTPSCACPYLFVERKYEPFANTSWLLRASGVQTPQNVSAQYRGALRLWSSSSVPSMRSVDVAPELTKLKSRVEYRASTKNRGVTTPLYASVYRSLRSPCDCRGCARPSRR